MPVVAALVTMGVLPWMSRSEHRPLRVREKKEKKMNLYLHNQWQMGNFWAQKPVKAGGEVLLDLY